MQDLGLSLAEECFREHLEEPAFRQGVERMWWGNVHTDDLAWPHVLFWIAAGNERTGPARFYLKFNLEGYPEIGPTASFWNPSKNQLAAATERPQGREDVAVAFRLWQPDGSLYVPWDRLCRNHHAADWQERYRNRLWNPTHTITFYLRMTHELLISDDYGNS